MKVVFVNRYFYPDHSATSQLLSDLAFDLADKGVEVWVVTSRQNYEDPQVALPAYEITHGVKVRRVWTSRFGRSGLFSRAIDYFTFYLSCAWRLLFTLSSGDVVVAKTDPPMISVIVALIARIQGATLINWCQDLFPEVASALKVKFIKRPVASALAALRNNSLRAAHVNVVLGERMAAYLFNAGIEREKIRVIPNWSDGSLIKPLACEQNPLRRDWGLSEKFVVGYSGNMGRAHEFATILDMATSLRERRDIVFLFIGGGARRAWIQQQVEQRGLENVVFKPYQPREYLAESLSVPDLHLISLIPELEGLIVPSKFYGIAAAGRPSLFIGDVAGEVPAILAKADCGYSVRIGDYEQGTEIITGLAMDPAKSKALGANARALFDRSFDMPLALKAWRETLSESGSAVSVAGKPIT